MILDHVTHRAGLVVELAAPFDADMFADGDLHMADASAAPQRFEQHVAEAQRDQVLHRLLAQVVIDAVDLLFLEDRADQLIDAFRGGAILSQRLLQDDARFGA